MCLIRPKPPQRSRADLSGLRLVDEACMQRRQRMDDLHRTARRHGIFQASLVGAMALVLCAWVALASIG
jgi:hypothetical protein